MRDSHWRDVEESQAQLREEGEEVGKHREGGDENHNDQVRDSHNPGKKERKGEMRKVMIK